MGDDIGLDDDFTSNAGNHITLSSDSENEEEVASSRTVPSGENKLVTNQLRKGQNSYYYAHKPRDSIKVVGETAPQKLDREPEPPKKIEPAFDSYSWADGKKIVSVYLPCEDAASLADDAATITWTARTIDFRATLPSGPKVFKLTKLQNDIKGATIKKKPGKFHIVLDKSEETSWYRLVSP